VANPAEKDLAAAVTIKAQEFDRLVEKWGLRTRKTGDLHAWFEHDGRVITRTRRSMGSGDLPMQHSIRQQLKLNDEQFREAISCKLDRNGYVDILKSKGLIATADVTEKSGAADTTARSRSAPSQASEPTGLDLAG
jgi:ABC-type oligopeptide transport system substrate-binding subunit